MTKLLFIRHGKTAWNHDDYNKGRYQGQTDVPLSPHGKEQAAKLAGALCQENISAFYASDLARAKETAQIIAKPHKKPVNPLSGLREIHYGIFEGCTQEECLKKHKKQFEERLKNKLEYKNPGGESPQEMQNRVVACVEEIIKKHPNDTIVLVVHNNVLKALVSHFLKKDFGELLHSGAYHFTSITEIEITKNKAKLVRYNHTDHLNDGKD